MNTEIFHVSVVSADPGVEAISDSAAILGVTTRPAQDEAADR